MEFEFDSGKSLTNKLKHGIDFVEAQALWRDEAMLEAPARTDDEPRFLAIGVIAGKHWSAVCVRRGGAIQLTSVRRSRREEIDHYEGG